MRSIRDAGPAVVASLAALAGSYGTANDWPIERVTFLFTFGTLVLLLSIIERSVRQRIQRARRAS